MKKAKKWWNKLHYHERPTLVLKYYPRLRVGDKLSKSKITKIYKMENNKLWPFEKGKVYENTSPVMTGFGVQPTGVKMKSEDWERMMSYTMKEEQFKRTFKVVKIN